MTTDKLSKDIKEFLKRNSTATFLLAARRFVELLESKNISKKEFCSKAHTALLELYSAGHKLDKLEFKYLNDDKDYDRKVIIENKNAGIISELGAQAIYWEIFDPTYSENDGQPHDGWTVTDKEPTQASLVDDFQDIYIELKTGLIKIDQIGTDKAIEDALWYLKWSFSRHWGQHCIDALRYFHYLDYDGKQTI
jgi:hypothetical protein